VRGVKACTAAAEEIEDVVAAVLAQQGAWGVQAGEAGNNKFLYIY
jgi:hypothetical protein